MATRKKSKRRSKAAPNVIVVVLTDQANQDAAMDSIQKKKKVGFEIEEVQQGTIPVVRAKNHPVQL